MRTRGHVKEVMRALGCDVARYRPLRSDPFAVQKQLLAGENCHSIFDCGAFRGDVAATYARHFPSAEIYAIEPDPMSFRLLKDRFGNHPRMHLVNAAISASSGEGTLHVNMDPSTNSLLPTGAGASVASAITTKQINVTTFSLDNFCEQQGLSPPTILKFDIQGGELEALRGAKKILGDCGPLLIYTEVLFVPLYRGCALFAEVAEFLSAHGYELFSLYSLHHAPNGRLEFGDALFVSNRMRSFHEDPQCR